MSDTQEIPVCVYIQHLKTTGKAAGAKTWGSLLNSFEHWLEDRKLAIDDIPASVVDEYLSTVGSPRSVLTAIRGYFRYRYMQLPMGDESAPSELQRYNQIGMIRTKRVPKKFEKMALSTDDLKLLLKRMQDAEVSSEMYAGVVVLFYFGARPGEMAEFLATAKISFTKREMFIKTEKTLAIRYLAWHPNLDPYMRTWYDFVTAAGKDGLPYPGQWLTMKLKYHMGKGRIVGGVEVTSRTARRTFETQSRLLGMSDLIIQATLGHTSKNISDVYTDFTQFGPIIRTALTENHYMIKGGVI